MQYKYSSFSDLMADKIKGDHYLIRTVDRSASDLIRSIWAYRLAFLELARHCDTNHLGCLILDEPGQQEMSEASLVSLLRRAASASGAEQQVILATSEDEQVVRAALVDHPATILNFDGWILRPL